MDGQAITRYSTLVHTYGWTGHNINKMFNTGTHVWMDRP